jgi:putative hydrolase of the HAD superfamily
MKAYHNIQAILFDSGRVLNYPRTGNWFVPPNFNKIVDTKKFEQIDFTLIKNAVNKANLYKSEQKLILTEEEEFILFKNFYTLISDQLVGLELTEEQITELAKDTVYNDEKFIFPEDVFEVIPLLSQSYKLGVVSDTWPSLERVFRNIGLRDYFSTFIMSSVLGVRKPDELMYITALNELGIKAEEAIFIDDNIVNLEGAHKLGIHTILMDRNKQVFTEGTEYVTITNLNDLQRFLSNE